MLNLTRYYFLDDKAMPDEPRVLHIGGDPGTKARLLQRWPAARVVTVDANPLLPADMHGALAHDNAIVTLHVMANRGASSLWPMHEASGQTCVDTIPIRGGTLGTLIAQSGLETLDLLLMNCEGAELIAFEQLAASPELRAKVPQICAALHWCHYAVYTREEVEEQLATLTQWYAVTHGRQHLPYVHLRRTDL